MPDAGKGVGEALEAIAVVVGGEFTLVQAMEVLQVIHDALGGVVEEETAHGIQGGVGGGAALKDHVANGLGHRKVNPGDDAVIHMCPLGVE
jgi:hypothetical protein